MGMHISDVTIHGRMVVQPRADFLVGGLNPCLSTAIGGAAAMSARPGFEPPTKKSAAGYITIRPLLTGYSGPPHCLVPSLPLTKTQTVCFCLTGHKYHHCCLPPPPSMEVQFICHHL